MVWLNLGIAQTKDMWQVFLMKELRMLYGETPGKEVLSL